MMPVFSRLYNEIEGTVKRIYSDLKSVVFDVIGN